MLNGELNIINLTGEIILADGASMCIVHEARDATKDIDALYMPKSIINNLVNKIAERENLPNNWLNDAIKPYI
jgi:hypothetical protein